MGASRACHATDQPGSGFAASDSYEDGAVPKYWNNTIWDRDKLIDGETNYVNVSTGATTNVGFFSGADASVGNWARFAMFFDTPAELGSIRMALGSPQGRVPREVKVFLATDYDFDANILGRSDAGMQLLWTITPDELANWMAIRWEEVSF